MKTDLPKRTLSETDFSCFGTYFEASWGSKKEIKLKKMGFRMVYQKEGLKKMSFPIGKHLQMC